MVCLQQPKWPRLQEGCPAIGARAEVPRAEFSKLEPRSIVTMAKRGKERPRGQAAGYSEDENKAKPLETRQDYRRGYPGDQLSGCAAERKPPHSGQQNPGTWRQRALKFLQLPTFRLHPLTCFCTRKQCLFLMPQRKEKAGREKEGRKREGEGVRMDASLSKTRRETA